MIRNAQVETRTYRIVLIDPGSQRLVSRAGQSDIVLLNIDVRLYSRHAAEIQSETYRKTSLSVLALDLYRDSSGIWFAICELLTVSVGYSYQLVSPSAAVDGSYSASFAARLRLIINGWTRSPFSRLGWINDAINWAETSIKELLAQKAEIRQLNVSDHFVLLSFRTIRGKKYWLKATGAPNAHECSITRRLYELARGSCPGACPIPTVTAVREDWNAWLQSGDGSPACEDGASGSGTWLIHAATALARLQVATMGYEQELLAGGGVDQRPESTRRALPEILEMLCEAMDRQRSTKVPRISQTRLTVLSETIARVLEQISQLGVPTTILHGDLNAGNILSEGDRIIRFIDWSEAYIGPCIVSLRHLLLLNKLQDEPLRASIERETTEAYLDVWRGVCDIDNLRKSLAYADLVAAFSTIYGRGVPAKEAGGTIDSFYSFVRPIARHMDRAAQQLKRAGR
ncbi:phosphotransferase family protein [Terriglobus albidus]|uniref:phosphotransferase family protein n=1 Tax=Terriglobus albidus TaxID=1592106 RepID=UPI0021E0BDB9|nr:phosphotransferase [Terriglobus albidus]